MFLNISKILLISLLTGLFFINCGKNIPVVSVVSPADNASVMGYVDIIVTASDKEGVESVDIFIDDTLRCTTVDSPYVYIWNTTVLDDNSSHRIYALARDYDKNESYSDTVTVTIKNIMLPFNDNFEKYTKLKYPSEGGWWPVWNSEAGTAFVDSGDAFEGYNYFYSQGTISEPRVDGVILDLSSADKVTYEFAVLCPGIGSSGGALVGFYVQPDSFSFYIVNAVLFHRYDHLVYVTGDTVAPTNFSWVEDTWYRVKVEIDYSTLLINAWVDTVQVMSGLNAVDKNTSKIFVLCSELNTDCVAIYDDIKIY